MSDNLSSDELNAIVQQLRTELDQANQTLAEQNCALAEKDRALAKALGVNVGKWQKLVTSKNSTGYELAQACASRGIGSFPFAWEIVGSLEEDVIAQLYEHIESTKEGSSKDDNPFLYIRNPPRHGKTLCLDMLYTARDGVGPYRRVADRDFPVIVIRITYNEGSTIEQKELINVEDAIAGFWTRAALALAESLNLSGDDLPQVDNGKSFFAIFSDLLKDCHAVLAVDELSKLLLHQKWSKKQSLPASEDFHVNELDGQYTLDLKDSPDDDDVSAHLSLLGFEPEKRVVKIQTTSIHKLLFFWSLTRFSRCQGGKFRRIVMTGFDHEPEQAICGSGFGVETFTIKQLSHSETSRLAIRILFSYVSANKTFPMHLYYILKCSPGLMGTWAAMTLRNSKATFPGTVDDFKASSRVLSWSNETNLAKKDPAIFDLIARVMLGTATKDEKHLLADRGLAVLDSATIRLVPYPLYLLQRDCFDVVKDKVSDDANQVFEQLHELFSVLETHASGEPAYDRDFIVGQFAQEAKEARWHSFPQSDVKEKTTAICGKRKEGDCFETFVARALCIRFLGLKAACQGSMSVGDLLPPGSTQWFQTQEGVPVVVVTERSGLDALVTSVCYDLFPVRINELLTKGDIYHRLERLAQTDGSVAGKLRTQLGSHLDQQGTDQKEDIQAFLRGRCFAEVARKLDVLESGVKQKTYGELWQSATKNPTLKKQLRSAVARAREGYPDLIPTLENDIDCSSSYFSSTDPNWLNCLPQPEPVNPVVQIDVRDLPLERRRACCGFPLFDGSPPTKPLTLGFSFPCASENEQPNEVVEAFDTLLKSHDGGMVAACKDSNKGCDVVIAGSKPKAKGKRTVLLIELKDRRNTTQEDWNCKIRALRDSAAVKEASEQYNFVVVLAGRCQREFSAL